MFCSDKSETDQQDINHGPAWPIQLVYTGMYVPCAMQNTIHKLNKVK